jgi:hypothetical protein
MAETIQWQEPEEEEKLQMKSVVQRQEIPEEKLYPSKHEEIGVLGDQVFIKPPNMQSLPSSLSPNYIQATKESDKYAAGSITHREQRSSKNQGTLQRVRGHVVLMPQDPNNRSQGTNTVKYMGAVPIGGTKRDVWLNYTTGQYIGAHGQVLKI